MKLRSTYKGNATACIDMSKVVAVENTECSLLIASGMSHVNFVRKTLMKMSGCLPLDPVSDQEGDGRTPLSYVADYIVPGK